MSAPTARSISVVVPVKDGAELLEELLAAVVPQVDEVLVIDSGSTDGSLEIARAAAGVRVMEIDPATFGHGRTRNLGAESVSGDVIAFITQDATPLPGWADALLAGFALADDVGAVYGPHRARPDTSPMIARELDQYFATKASPDGGPSLQREGDDAFLSNVNAAYRRDCWAALRFPDVPYSEDQHFAQAMLAAGWAKAYNPDAAVLHAHDYPPVAFARRYFDEYRGLRASVGHVEPLNINSARDVRALVAADRAWMREHGYGGAGLARWTARSAVHQTSRKVFGALGSRAEKLPAPVQKRISLEGTAVAATAPDPVEDAAALAPPPITGKVIKKAWRDMVFSAVLEYQRRGGPAPLLEPLTGQDVDVPLHVACVIPPFSRGSGGHTTIFNLMSRLERMGHTVTYWIDDPVGLMDASRGARVRRDIQDWFAPIEGPVFKGFGEWYGADVALATGWQTAHPVALLQDVRARAYLINDHEPEFYATSVEEKWAQETYTMGMHHICASPWLADIMRDTYGGTASLFDLSVDTDVYHPTGFARQPDTIVLYGRASTARRAVPLAIMAIAELKRRRPDVRVLSFGDTREIDMPFEYEHLGVLSPAQLAQLYNEGTVGVVLSLTNYSLIPQEMLACGMPCVDLAGVSAESVFGADGPVALAPLDAIKMADVVEHLLHDEDEWKRRSAAGLAFVEGRTWDHAARQTEAGLREALRLRRA
ncbi:glycosyltransferase [Conexibacter woesei]|uniref:rhamnosyltransferase WsaF family glycosyltransferase n=1 Tax=Conexibacter woesei TaxID=191495 RepID=UPI0004065669|nr:glycosyltransferase [Conexibacter woesei]